MIEVFAFAILGIAIFVLGAYVLHFRESRNWWRIDSGYWSNRALLAESERDDFKERYYQYENAITWDTTCLNCANLLDRSYEDYVKADILSIQSRKALAFHPEPEVKGSICTGCGYVYPCPTVKALTEDVEDPGVQAFKSL